MIPSLFLLTGFAVAPTPLQLFLAQNSQRWDQSAKASGRQPEANGPNAIYQKYHMVPLGMTPWEIPRVVTEEEKAVRALRLQSAMKEIEQARKEAEERFRQRRLEVDAQIAFLMLEIDLQIAHSRWKKSPAVQLLNHFVPIPPSWLR